MHDASLKTPTRKLPIFPASKFSGKQTKIPNPIMIRDSN
jgi:hypothetical protein